MSDHDNKNEFSEEENREERYQDEQEFHKDDEPKKKKFSFNDDDDDAWWEESSTRKKIAMGFGIAILIIGGIALLGVIVMNLWNWLMPEIFNLPTIDYAQTWGLMILTTILFKPMGSSSSSGSKDRKRKKELRRYMEEEERRKRDSRTHFNEGHEEE